MTLKIEIDNKKYAVPFLTSNMYASLITEDILKLHLKENINCNFEVYKNEIIIILKNCANICINDIYEAILLAKKNKNIRYLFFPIKSVSIMDDYILKLETWFYAPLLKDILQAPWLLERQVSDTNISSNISFLVNTDFNERMKLLKNNVLDATWPSNGIALDKTKYIKNYNFYNLSGNNIVMLESKNSVFLHLVQALMHEIKAELKNQLTNQLDPINSFILNYYFKERSIYCLNKTELQKNYTLGYLNYYPNKMICKIIKEALTPYTQIKLQNLGYIEQNEWKENNLDSQLIIVSPMFFSKYSIILEMIADFETNNKLDLVKKIYALKEDQIIQDIACSKHFIPIASTRNIFWQSSKYDKCIFDEFGRLKIYENR